jgi:hypothetical protein
MEAEKKRTKKAKKAKKEKRVTRDQRVEKLKEHAKEYAFTYSPNVIDLVKNPDVCAEVTYDTCWRPDIYLNNHRTCNNCSIVEHCKCSCRRLEKKKNAAR